MFSIFKKATDFYNEYADSLYAGYSIGDKPSSWGGHNCLWQIFDGELKTSE